jgi:DNA-binding transcriptional LysR family regulator
VPPFCLAVGRDNPLARKDSATLAECADQTWVLPRLGSTYRRHIEAMILTQSVDWPSSEVYANSLMLIEGLVVSGGCVTFVSPLQLRMPLTDFKVLRVEKGSSRKIGLKVRAGTRLSPLGRAFQA